MHLKKRQRSKFTSKVLLLHGKCLADTHCGFLTFASGRLVFGSSFGIELAKFRTKGDLDNDISVLFKKKSLVTKND
jgi:hypothetical protein